MNFVFVGFVALKHLKLVSRYSIRSIKRARIIRFAIYGLSVITSDS